MMKNIINQKESDIGQQSSLLINDDCLVALKSIPDSSVDMIMCDLPYG
jgi:DNA modification methylase